MIYGKKFDNKEGGLNWTQPFPRVWGYKRGSDITEGDIMEVVMHLL